MRNEWIRRLFEYSPDAFVAMDSDGRITEWNRQAEAVFGWSRSEALGRIMSETIIPPALREAHHAGFQRFLATGEGPVLNRRVQMMALHRWGHEFPVELVITPLRLDRGHLFCAFIHDITERKKAEEARSRLAAIVEGCDDAIIGKTQDGVIVSWNPGAERLFGYTAAEVIGKPISILTPRGWTEESLRILDKTRHGEGVEHHETIRQRKDGRLVDVSLTISPIRDSKGRVVGASTIARDITERKRAEEALRRAHEDLELRVRMRTVELEKANQALEAEILERQKIEAALSESEELFRNMADTAPVLIWLSDSTSARTFFNRPWLEFRGRTLADELGQGWLSGVIADDRPSYLETSTAAIDARKPFRIEYRLRGRELGPRWVLETGVPRFAAAGTFLGYIGSCIDITDRRAAEEALRAARDRLEERVLERTSELAETVHDLRSEVIARTQAEGDLKVLNETLEERVAERSAAAEAHAKELARSNADLQQFAYVASHDLQEPLRMVASFTDLLAKRYRDKLDASADEYIHYILDGVNWMQALIRDLLAYSRVGTHGQPFEPTGSKDALERAMAHLCVAIEGNGAAVTCDPLPQVMADPIQLTEVFQNLIGNALKFRGPDAPRVHVSAMHQGSEWVFFVRDNGIGIDPSQAGRLFQIFQRLHGRADYAGTGVGLAICKKIVERHGGRIWMESRPGKGSTFFFTLRGVEE